MAVDVVFRHTPNLDPTWQFYADAGLCGGENTLAEAKAETLEAAKFSGFHDGILSHVEWPAGEEGTVFVRAFQDPDDRTRLARQDFALRCIEEEKARGLLAGWPVDLYAVTGDRIMVAVFPEELLWHALRSMGDMDTVFLATVLDDGLVVQPVSGPRAENVPVGAQSLGSVGLSGDSTVRDLFAHAAKGRTLVSA